MQIERTRLWLSETRDDLHDLPAWLLALVTALGLAAGVFVTWWRG